MNLNKYISKLFDMLYRSWDLWEECGVDYGVEQIIWKELGHYLKTYSYEGMMREYQNDNSSVG